ncbi:hypothetical protein QJS04_geneDACA010110 [Acorus gramineus]|uniref:Glyoxal oxidase N-terminal domain-containing protein n=1 Tax=Acorus gramineus TaxID=55184 RepID=A0AAV9BF78_ACOGR|nr:hypothetical protein QJS04_geneDACA010110 [Acorus gramineus]
MTSPLHDHRHLHDAHSTPPQQGLHLRLHFLWPVLSAHPSTLYSSSNCTAHSLLLDPIILSLSPRHLLFNTFCSSASLLPDGTLLQSSGFSFGDRLLRPFPPISLLLLHPL